MLSNFRVLLCIGRSPLGRGYPPWGGYGGILDPPAVLRWVAVAGRGGRGGYGGGKPASILSGCHPEAQPPHPADPRRTAVLHRNPATASLAPLPRPLLRSQRKWRRWPGSMVWVGLREPLERERPGRQVGDLWLLFTFGSFSRDSFHRLDRSRSSDRNSDHSLGDERCCHGSARPPRVVTGHGLALLRGAARKEPC
jgi:hypothetical protein